MNLQDSLQISAYGMAAESTRLRVVAENLANADSTAATPGGNPYRRKTVTFQEVMDKNLGVPVVKTAEGIDPSDFGSKYAPWHPAADANGYIKTSNVNSVVELTDLREARRSYESNLSAVQVTRGMLQQTLDLLK